MSIAKNTQFFLPCTPTLKNKFAVCLRDWWYNFKFMDKLAACGALDFIGINYYSPSIVNVGGWGLRSLILDVCSSGHHPFKKNSMGWYIYPEGLYGLLTGFKKYHLPIIITENGICTTDDNLRWDYIRRHLAAVSRAISEGADVRGYLYWSLLDNFEWDKGFGPRFGLIEVDYRTFARTVRDSARRYAEVCQSGKLI